MSQSIQLPLYILFNILSELLKSGPYKLSNFEESKIKKQLYYFVKK